MHLASYDSSSFDLVQVRARVYCIVLLPGAPEEGVNVYEYGCGILIQECGWISVGWARSRMQDPTIALGLSAVVLSVIITTTECGT